MREVRKYSQNVGEPGLESNLSDYRSMQVPLFYFAKNKYNLPVGGIELSTIDVQRGEKSL